MSIARTASRVGGGILVLLVVAAGGLYVWADAKTGKMLSTKPPVHNVGFPIPAPLSADEAAALPAGQAEVVAVARERGAARGKHLIETLYTCGHCHGDDFGGKVMIDSPVFGSLIAPNLTSGRGSVVKDYTAADWDHIVRHGVRRDGTASVMPAKEFERMSDRELADLVTYLRSVPPVDREMPPTKLGPALKIGAATGQIDVSALVIDPKAPHLAAPPVEAPSADYGRHIVQPCTGCHNDALSGGPIKGGEPSWPPATNLTPKAQAGRSFDDFQRVMRTGERPDGTKVHDAMPWRAYKGMSDTELQATWAFLKTLPPKETGTL